MGLSWACVEISAAPFCPHTMAGGRDGSATIVLPPEKTQFALLGGCDCQKFLLLKQQKATSSTVFLLQILYVFSVHRLTFSIPVLGAV